MACFTQFSPSRDEMWRKRDEFMPLIKSVSQDLEPRIVVENLKELSGFIKVFNVDSIDEEVLVFVSPVLKTSLEKCYGDNVMIVTTTDDVDMQDILKENLQTALKLLLIYKDIVDYFLLHSDVKFGYLKNLPINLSLSLFCTFKHCQSHLLYKKQFTMELLEIFNVAQGLQNSLLKVVDNCLVEDLENFKKEISHFLDLIIDVGEVLSDMNVRSMVENWKSYTSLMKKFAIFVDLEGHLRKTLLCLDKILTKNMLKLQDGDEKNIVQTTKILSFLTKVLLKICDNFWGNLGESYDVIMGICINVYRFKYKLGNSFEESVLELIEPFLVKLANEESFLKVILQTDEHCDLLGVLNVLIGSLQINIDLLKKIFDTVKCLNLNQQTLYEDLMINCAASILSVEDLNVETLLLHNVLQENIWCSLLAIDVWCLVISHSHPQTSTDCLKKLINLYQTVDFGIFTNRIEKINFCHLIARIYKLLPINMKKQIIQKYPISENLKLWNNLGYSDANIQEIRKLETICTKTMLTVDNIKTVTNPEELLTAIAYVEAYCKINTTAEPEIIKKIILDLWKAINYSPNNILHYFIHKLCKITAKTIGQMSSTQLITILEQASVLASENPLKHDIILILSSLIHSQNFDFSNDQQKIFYLISGIIYPILLTNVQPPIKMQIYSFIKDMYDSSFYNSVVKMVLQNAKQLQGEIGDCLKENSSAIFDYQAVEKFSYRHNCICWNERSNLNFEVKSGKFRSIENVAPHAKRGKFEDKIENKIDNKIEDKTEEESNIGDCLSNLKGEVKCLMNVLKTEKMTSKEVSQLRTIVGQLQTII